jgi:3'-phosphoadenosine 5'-phosphosulfate sulfotransferase (PAPS reductase)/FAD synthetase
MTLTLTTVGRTDVFCRICEQRVEACKVVHHRKYDCERFQRVTKLIGESHDIVARAIEDHFDNDGRTVAAKVVLYSGGNDSTTLAHMFKGAADYAAHCNTGIGIEQTREFVRETCAAWGLPLIEVHPPAGSTYEELVVAQGFPGPGHHFKMYQRLKERGLREVRKQVVNNPRRERVLFLAGRRREESKRRASIPESDRQGSIVFVSPLVSWTKADLNTYRIMHPDVPRNQVSDTLHMSGECLCGAFAHAGELDEIRFWFPDTAAHIDGLEEKVRAAGHPEKKCKWGWGQGASTKPSKSGIMCSSCDSRFLSDVDMNDGDAE